MESAAELTLAQRRLSGSRLAAAATAATSYELTTCTAVSCGSQCFA